MCTGIVDGNIVTDIDLRQHPVDGEFVVVLAQGTGHIVLVVAGLVFLAQYSDVMVSAVHGRTHQVHGTGIHTDVFLMSMLLMDDLGHQMSVRCHHITTKLCVDCHITHACRYQNFLIYLTHAFADDSDVVGFLIRTVRNTDTTGQIDEGNVCAGLLFQLYCQFEQFSCQSGIIVIRYRVTGQKRMDTEILHTLCLQDLISLKHLLRGETVFSIARIVHDVIADGKISAGIVTAAQGLGQITDGLLQEIDMGDVIQIDGGTDFCRIFEFMGRGIVGGEHNVLSLYPHSIAEHQLCQRGAVTSTAVIS